MLVIDVLGGRRPEKQPFRGRGMPRTLPRRGNSRWARRRDAAIFGSAICVPFGKRYQTQKKILLALYKQLVTHFSGTIREGDIRIVSRSHSQPNCAIFVPRNRNDTEFIVNGPSGHLRSVSSELPGVLPFHMQQFANLPQLILGHRFWETTRVPNACRACYHLSRSAPGRNSNTRKRRLSKRKTYSPPKRSKLTQCASSSPSGQS